MDDIKLFMERIGATLIQYRQIDEARAEFESTGCDTIVISAKMSHGLLLIYWLTKNHPFIGIWALHAPSDAAMYADARLVGPCLNTDEQITLEYAFRNQQYFTLGQLHDIDRFSRQCLKQELPLIKERKIPFYHVERLKSVRETSLE